MIKNMKTQAKTTVSNEPTTIHVVWLLLPLWSLSLVRSPFMPPRLLSNFSCALSMTFLSLSSESAKCKALRLSWAAICDNCNESSSCVCNEVVRNSGYLLACLGEFETSRVLKDGKLFVSDGWMLVVVVGGCKAKNSSGRSSVFWLGFSLCISVVRMAWLSRGGRIEARSGACLVGLSSRRFFAEDQLFF